MMADPIKTAATESTARSERLLGLRQVEDKVSMKKSAIYDRIREGAFPVPVSIGGISVRWREAEIDDWIRTLPKANHLRAA